MTNEEKINRLRELERCMPIYTKEDVRDFEALEGAIEAIETLDKIESRLRNVLKELEEGLLADNRLIAVSGMSIEELTDAFMKGYRLVGPEAFKSDIPDDLRIVPKNTREQTNWIPVSKRLPEDRREVLVTAYWHGTYQVMMASYYGDGLWWCVPFNNCGEHMQRLNPKAWMPVPTPYEPQKRSE